MNPDQFVGDLIIRVLPHWEMPEGACPQYELQEPFTFLSMEFGRIHVPRGFITDFGSVPTAVKPIIDNDDPDLVLAAIPHDWIYRNHGAIENQRIGRALTRYEADCVLYEAMIASGAPKLKSWLVFRAVRIGGIGAWQR